MKVSRSLKIYSLFVMLPLLFSVAYATVDQGYEDAKTNDVVGICPAGSGILNDAFGGIDSHGKNAGGFGICECVSYVAYRLRLNDVKLWKNQTNSYELFVNHNWGNTTVHWGNGGTWNNSATTAGIREDQYPAIGSVANDTKSWINL